LDTIQRVRDKSEHWEAGTSRLREGFGGTGRKHYGTPQRRTDSHLLGLLLLVNCGSWSSVGPQQGGGKQIMTTGGWITMSLSVGFVVVLFVWCVWRVLTSKPEHIHGIEDIDTQDQND
jgi:hypothetical protein